MKLEKPYAVIASDCGAFYQVALGHLDVVGFTAAIEATLPGWIEENDPIDEHMDLEHMWATSTGEGDDFRVDFHVAEQPDSQPVTVIFQ